MKPFFFCLGLVGLAAMTADGQDYPDRIPDSERGIALIQSLTGNILAKQFSTGSYAKGTSIQKRLTGYSLRQGSSLTDSGRNVYSGARGSDLSDDQTYFSTAEETELFFLPQDPLSVQYIHADSSLVYGLNGGGPLHLLNSLFNSYDASNRLIKGIFRSTISGYRNYEQVVSYNANNQRLTVQQRDTTQGGVLTDKQKHLFFYDAQHRIILDSVVYVPLNIASRRTVYSYNSAGLLGTMLLQNNSSNGFVNANKSDFTYDGSGRLLAASGSQDNGSGWFPTFRDTLGYTGAYTHYSYRALQSWNAATGQWQNSNSGLFYTLDIGPGNQVQRIYYKYLIGNSVSTSAKSEYFYNGSNLIDSIQLSNATGGGSFAPPFKLARFYYEDYATTTVAGVNGKTQVFIYPNPASDQLFIKGDLKGNYSIACINGQTIASGAVPAPGAAIDVSGLMPGIYTISLKDNAGKPIGNVTYVKH